MHNPVNDPKKLILSMQRSTIKLFLMLLLIAMATAGCGSGKGLFGKKNDCGCPNKKGMVGY
jgi:hypothetical protein